MECQPMAEVSGSAPSKQQPKLGAPGPKIAHLQLVEASRGIWGEEGAMVDGENRNLRGGRHER